MSKTLAPQSATNMAEQNPQGVDPDAVSVSVDVSAAPAEASAAPTAPSPGRTADKVFKICAWSAGILIFLALAAVTIFLILRALPAFTGDPAVRSSALESLSGGRASNFASYVGPLLFGTILIAGLSLLLAFPVSTGIALFITHYAPRKLSTALSSVVDLLAAIPSVIYGLWGALVLVPAITGFWNWVATYLGWIPIFAGPAAAPARSVASVALVLAVMILPIITSVARDIFAQAPRLQQEAALALGATKWETIRLAVLPFARSGLISASMLGLGRALGETMAVLMILSPGFSYSLHILQASTSQTIAANIASQFPEADSMGVAMLVATGLVLFVITFLVNFLARRITGKGVSK
ncbi:phosphate transport system permease protein [Bombiscardovia apis]|uniref:Phosphate transport system permease protein n=1 Tax=Bombiscardovia apis TaxID=2932182 RepID=A0ABM8BC76_9BIFI|nr:phosphate ABC transporter permease subunit PstC [Bombiscardovia apis]BDR54240.1 phosphate transport system permease protein [Bombiscardovia apis]